MPTDKCINCYYFLNGSSERMCENWSANIDWEHCTCDSFKAKKEIEKMMGLSGLFKGTVGSQNYKKVRRVNTMTKYEAIRVLKNLLLDEPYLGSYECLAIKYAINVLEDQPDDI